MTTTNSKQAAGYAQATLAMHAERVQQQHAADGNSIWTKVTVGVDDGTGYWAGTLATMLIVDPALAKLSLLKLAERLAAAMEVERFEHTKMSRPLSNAQQQVVSKMLTDAGYDVATLKTGTSIRNIVKRNIRFGSGKAGKEIVTRFHADGVEIDGRKHHYRQRERTPTGNAWHDFSVRVAGVDVPLAAVLKLRNVGISEFQAADNKAMQTATVDALAARSTVSRQGEVSLSLRKLQTAVEQAQTLSCPEALRGTTIAAMARIWWQTLSPTRKESVGVYDMAQTLFDNPEARAAVQRWVARVDP